MDICVTKMLALQTLEVSSSLIVDMVGKSIYLRVWVCNQGHRSQKWQGAERPGLGVRNKSNHGKEKVIQVLTDGR